MPLPLPSKEEWAAWLDNGVTKAFFEVLQRGRDDLMNDWAGGKFFGGPDMMIENARAIGRCETLESVSEMTYDELIGALDDDSEHIGPETVGPGGPSPAS